MTIPQEEAIKHISQTMEGKLLVEFLKDILKKYADVRNITDMSMEGIKANQIACNIIEDEIISRLTRETTEVLEITEEFE